MKNIPLTWSESNSRSTKRLIQSYRQEDRVTGKEVVVRADASRLAVNFSPENIERLNAHQRGFLHYLRGMVGLPPFTRRLYVLPPNSGSRWYERRWMTHAESGDLWLGLQFPKGHLPSKKAILERPFASWPELCKLNPMGNHALGLLIANKDKVGWNSHHTSIDLISQALDAYSLTYRVSCWEIAVDTCNSEIGRFIQDHAMITYIRYGSPNTFFYYDDEDHYYVGVAPDGYRQYVNGRDKARQSLGGYERVWTCRFTQVPGLIYRFEYRLKWPYIKTKIDRDSENLIEELFRLTRPLTEGCPDNPRQAHIAFKRLHLNELPRSIRSKASALRGKPVMYQIDWLLREGVDKQIIYKCLENLPWPSQTIWTTDTPNAPLWTCLDNVLNRRYVEDVLARRERPERQTLISKV